MKKKVYINGRFLTQRITGVQRYALELVKALDNLITIGEIDKTKFSFIIVAPNYVETTYQFKNISIIYRGRFKSHLWEQLELPFFVKKQFLINLCNSAPIFKRNQMVTIHDAAVYAFKRNFSPAFSNFYKFLFFILVKTIKRIITVSVFSKNEIIKYTKANYKKINVTYEGREQIIALKGDNKVLNDYDIKKNRFIFAVSSLSKNKNFHSLVKAIELIKNYRDFEIVIAGGVNPKIFKNFPDLPNNIKYIGYISDCELRALYENATCFVYPSFYEGFGLPPLEAMACGCPVIVSNAASLPEVCGDAALYCDPSDPQDIADKISVMMSNLQLRETLRKKGLKRAEQFSWEKCARETFAVIEEVLAH